MPHVQYQVRFEVAGASRAEIMAAVRELYPAATEADDAALHTPVEAAIEGSDLRIAIDDTSGTNEVVLDGSSPLRLPFFEWAIGPLIEKQLMRIVDHAKERIEATLGGAEQPSPPRPILLLPSVPFTPEQATCLATYAFVTTLATFGGALLGQMAGPIADTFGASDTDLANVISLSRIGVLVGLFASAVADRKGRRTLALWSLGGIAFANAIAAVAPSLGVLGGSQMLARGFVNAAAIIAGIAAVEEAPDGARAFSATMTAMAGGMGFAIAVISFAFTDLAGGVWRIGFALSALTLFLLPRVGRALPESSRYARLAGTEVARGRLRDLFAPRYRGRIVLAALIAFCTNLFNSPSSQFMNKYLSDDRDYSAAAIFLFRSASGVLPGLLGMVIASRMTETHGRKPVAIVGLLVGTVALQGFFLASGIPMWVGGMLSIVLVASGSIAMGTLDTELFPTRVRGTAGAVLLVAGVTGSVTGIQIAGRLSDSWGSLGNAIAVTGIGTLVAAACFIPLLPESHNRSLDELSPDHAGDPEARPATEPTDGSPGPAANT